MALEVYAKYLNASKTHIVVRDSDPMVDVGFVATCSGDMTSKTDEELLELAISWFTNKYIQEYANQKTTEKVSDVEAAVKTLNDFTKDSKKKFEEMQESQTELETRLSKAEEERNSRFKAIEDKFKILNGSVMEMVTEFYANQGDSDASDATSEKTSDTNNVDGSDNSASNSKTETETE